MMSRRSDQRVVVLLLALCLGCRCAHSSALLRHLFKEDNEFVSGTIPLDTDGHQVQAHEGCIVELEDSYLWYGTGQKQRVGDDWISSGINLYTSRDLSTWRHKGTVFSESQIPGDVGARPFRLERPIVLYNEHRRYYTLLLHVDTLANDVASVAVATSPSPYGPFVLQRVFKPDGLGSYDLTAVQETGGDAYLVRNVEDKYIGISKLSGDHLDTTGVCSQAPRAAAPALFKHDQRWYMLASRHAGWQPSAPLLFVNDGPDLCGSTWTRLPRPAAGEGADTTFNSQPAFVYTHHFSDDKVLHVYYGDRWNADGPGSVANASYVWLPLLPHADGPGFLLQNLPAWSLDDFRPAPS